MPTDTFDRAATLAAIDHVADQMSTMVGSASDLGIRVPGTPQWTIAETYSHVATVVPRYSQGARHEGEWVSSADDLADLNQRQLVALGPVPEVETVSVRLRNSLDELRQLITGLGDDQPTFTFHGGQRIQSDVALGILLGEVVVHGHDIARALHRPWPIDPAHVQLITLGLTPILPGWLDARASGHNGRYEVRLRGQGVHRFAFNHGRLTMNPPGAFEPDAIISAAPGPFLLVVYKRISQWPAILAGHLVAWGRRPWLALTFASRFHRP